MDVVWAKASLGAFPELLSPPCFVPGPPSLTAVAASGGGQKPRGRQFGPTPQFQPDHLHFSLFTDFGAPEVCA